MSNTLHIHVGQNMPGCLPESDVMCFAELDGALDALKHALKDQQDFYYESCEGHCPDCAEFEACGGSAHGETCDWCDAASDVEAALSAIKDGGPDEHFVREGRASWIFRTPEGPDMHHWALSIEGGRTACEIAQDQDDNEPATGDNTALNAAESVRKDATDPTLTVGDTVFCHGVYATVERVTLHAPWTHNASPIRNDWTAEEIITAEGSRWHGHAPDGPAGDVTD